MPRPRLRETNGALGICGAPDDAYQVLRGLRTMGVRLERHQQSALAIARWLEGRDNVPQVLHPALPSFVGDNLWKRDFKGRQWHLCSRAKGRSQTQGASFPKCSDAVRARLLRGRLQEPCAARLFDRKVAPPPPGSPVLRLQIGLEDVEDLIADLEKGFAAASAA
ncbi:PLP-dependent transferase [Rhizobium rhizogenes]|uniref:PLP-dependent transferase n=1 Tax=Rhizobium rhizogenes TaxID=359 RepID=UPI0023574F32|nr:PLP-dependent transferase [Rhizobium rhizogenes]